MDTRPTPQEAATPLQRAIEAVGTQQQLADLLGCKSPSISGWRVNGIPLERCVEIERLTGVRCEELRDDVTWIRGLDGAPTSYVTQLPPLELRQVG